MKDKSIIVSFRLPESELRKLQLLAQVYERSVGELIRVAVGKHVEELTHTAEFKTRGLELKWRNEQMLNELLSASGATCAEVAPVPSVAPINVQLTPLSILEPPRYAQTPRSLVSVEIAPSTGTAHIGAAASHKAPSLPPAQSRFTLIWNEGGHDWRIEGISAGSKHELVLSSADGSRPRGIIWVNPATGDYDALTLENASDGRMLIHGISMAHALKRAEAIRVAANTTRQLELLPVVAWEAQ